LFASTATNGIAKSCISGIQNCMDIPRDQKQIDSSQHDWSLYRSFLAVVRDGTLSGAARTLGITQPTVGRHIATLESSLGDKPLFTRSQEGLLPTDVARDLLPHAEAMASAADALIRAASGQSAEVAGTIRISASDVVGAEVLPTMLAEFRDAYPKVSIELSLANQTVDLLRRDADIAVRMVAPAQKALLARKIGSVPLTLYAKKSYLEKHGTPRDFDELQQHAVIGFDAMLPPDRIMKSLPLKITRDFFALRCDNDLGQLAALRAGFGIGSCQAGIARRDPDLVPVLADQLSFDMELWVVMHENLSKVKRMRLMFDHLVVGLTQFVEQSK
jgi:DNA-binding transcriptional LysR family regulator